MLRSIGAVAAGYIVFGALAALVFQLAGQEPHEAAPIWFKVVSIACGSVAALIAGWLTARIAVRRPATHAAILAGLIAIGAIASIAADLSGEKWSQTSAAVIMAPCAWIGGRLAAARKPA